jgi:hypothetical protein
MNSLDARKALEVLRARCGQRTDVILSSGRTIAVWDIAWGCDTGDDFDHVTTNISPGPSEPHEIDFIYTSEISVIVDFSSGEILFEGPPGLRRLSSREQSLVRECLEYVLNSGALSGEFDTRMGVTQHTVQALLERWPEVDHCGDESPSVAVNNALNEVAHGLRISPDEWKRWFTGDRADVLSVYSSWAKANGLSTTGLR